MCCNAMIIKVRMKRRDDMVMVMEVEVEML